MTDMPTIEEIEAASAMQNLEPFHRMVERVRAQMTGGRPEYEGMLQRSHVLFGVACAYVLAAHLTVPGWRENDEPDPHGERYDCEQIELAGGHLTDDQVAFGIMSRNRTEPGFVAFQAMARDRIRWLSRKLHRVTVDASERELALEAGIREAVALFRDYERQHRAKVPEKPDPGEAGRQMHEFALAKAYRNRDIAAKLEALIAPMADAVNQAEPEA